MSEPQKKNSPSYSSLGATYVVSDTNERVSSFTINGILREDLITEIKTTIHDYIQKSRLTLSNSYYSAQSVTTPLEDSTSGEVKKNAD